MKRLIAVVLCAGLLGAAPSQKVTSKLQWRNIGPFIGGRVAVAGVPSEPSTFCTAYQPTGAEYATYDELRPQALAGIVRLKAITAR